MNPFINRLVSEATTPIGDMSTRLFKMAVLYFLTMSCLFAGTVFLTIAFFEVLQPLEGYTGAALAVGGLYLVAALICIVVIAREKPRHTGQTDVTGLQATAARMEDKPMPPRQSAVFADKIDETVVPLLGILRDAGMERERLALEAGTEIVKKLNPLALIVVAALTGVVLARAVDRDHFSRRMNKAHEPGP
jgi:uncharacterized membrane protein YccC